MSVHLCDKRETEREREREERGGGGRDGWDAEASSSTILLTGPLEEWLSLVSHPSCPPVKI